MSEKDFLNGQDPAEIHELYRQFEEELLTMSLSSMESAYARQTTIEAHRIMTHKELVRYLQTLPTRTVEKLIKRWRGGYARYLQHRNNAFCKQWERYQEWGLPESIRQKLTQPEPPNDFQSENDDSKAE